MMLDDLKKFVDEYCVKSDNCLISKNKLFRLYKCQYFEKVSFLEFKKYCDSVFKMYSGNCFSQKNGKRRYSHNVYKVYFEKNNSLIFDSKIREHENYMGKKNNYKTVEGFLHDFKLGKNSLGLKLTNSNGENLGTFYLPSFNSSQKAANRDIKDFKKKGLKLRIEYLERNSFKDVIECKVITPNEDETSVYYLTSGQAKRDNGIPWLYILKFNNEIPDFRKKRNESLEEVYKQDVKKFIK